MKTDPRTRRPYRKGAFANLALVEDLLALVDSPVPADVITSWTEAEAHEAGDWALRAHLRASDNLNRVPPKPAHVKAAESPRAPLSSRPGNSGTVMDIIAGERW